ncbi:MAG: type II secretion system protein [Patescibacteria group bacterium]
MLNKKQCNNEKKGFTLIELLVVISIIGLLSSMAVYAFNASRVKARDAKRLADMRQIVLALGLYYDDYDNYPQENSSDGSWENSYEDGGDFIDFLKDLGYMSQVPVDPVNTTGSGQYYGYYVYPAGGAGCDASRGEYFVLGARDMETSGRPHPSSPGWSCPSRNWQGEFDWVTGDFER